MTDIRSESINKNNIRITRNNTLIILDYDDTLFPTTYVMKNNINLYDPEVRNRYIDFFSELDDFLYKLLKKLLDYGKIIIITNAYPQWVRTSSFVIPNTQYLLNRLKVISAKQKYIQKSNNMMDWKKMAFQDEILSNKNIFNIISIGDMECEYNALISLHDLEDRHKLLKSVKFVSGPNYDVLLDQLQVLYDAVPKICLTFGYLDMNFKFFNTFGNGPIISN